MDILRKGLTLTLLLTLCCATIRGNEGGWEQVECGYRDNDVESAPAYAESKRTAHWSVYIPITILVVAAIGFGVADKHHSKHRNSDSQDALGSIDSSKRHKAHTRYTPYNYRQCIGLQAH